MNHHASFIHFNKNGRIGINTSSSLQKIDIRGNVYFTNSIGIGTTLPRNILDIQTGNFNIQGNIGIGTTLPKQKLDINNGNIILSGNLGIGTNIPNYNLHIIGNSYIKGAFILANNTDPTKIATFNTDNLTTSTTSSYQFPKISTSLMGGTLLRLSSTFNTTNTTPSYPSISTTLVNGTYGFKYDLIYQTPNLLDGIAISMEFTGSSSSFIYTTRVSSSDSQTISKVFTTSGGTTTTTSVGAENINYPISIIGTIVVSSTGTLRVAVASNRPEGSLSIIAGSLGHLYII